MTPSKMIKQWLYMAPIWLLNARMPAFALQPDLKTCATILEAQHTPDAHRSPPPQTSIETAQETLTQMVDLLNRIQERQYSTQALNSDLIEACKRHDVGAVVALLSKGADANARDAPILIPPLSYRIHYNATHPDAPTNIDEILPENATARDRQALEQFRFVQGPPALLLAVDQWSPELIQANFSPEYYSTLMPASLSRINLVSALLRKGARVNVADEQGITPLMIAARNLDNEMMQLLLDHGADVNAKDRLGKNALYWAAAIYRFPDLRFAAVTFLIHHKADVSVVPRSGETLFDHAGGDSLLANLLRSHGAKSRPWRYLPKSR